MKEPNNEELLQANPDANVAFANGIASRKANYIKLRDKKMDFLNPGEVGREEFNRQKHIIP